MAHRNSQEDETLTFQRPPTYAPSTRVLVVGGHGSFVVDRLRANLRRHNIEIVHHWDYALRRPPEIPQDIDAVYICTDAVSHNLSDAATAGAKKRGLRIISGSRKWAPTAQHLRLLGFHDKPPTSIPIDAIPDTLPNLPDTLPENKPPPPEEKMTELTPTSAPENMPDESLRPYIEVLARVPGLEDAQLFAEMLRTRPGIRFDKKIAAAARSALGIVVRVFPKRGRVVEADDLERREAVAAAYGVVLSTSPATAHAPAPAPVPAPVLAPVPSNAPTTTEKEELMLPTPPNKTSTANEQIPLPNIDFAKKTMKELIDAIRVKMVTFNIEEITITPTSAPAKIRATVDLG